jgi:tetratricopeptide (TPR) repeat protein
LLIDKYSRYYHETGQYGACEAWLEKAKGLAARTSQVDDAVLSKLHYYHGRLFLETNHPEKAVQSLEEATGPYENVNRESRSYDDTYLTILYENVGMSYTGANRFDDAKKYLNKAIEMAKKPGAASQSVIGDFMQCIGACHLWSGDLGEAEDILCRALLERCGENNENRGGAMYTLGNVYLRQGKYLDALQLHQEVLEIYTRDLGNMHHWVADSCHKVGSILAIPDFKQHNLIEAE